MLDLTSIGHLAGLDAEWVECLTRWGPRGKKTRGRGCRAASFLRKRWRRHRKRERTGCWRATCKIGVRWGKGDNAPGASKSRTTTRDRDSMLVGRSGAFPHTRPRTASATPRKVAYTPSKRGGWRIGHKG